LTTRGICKDSPNLALRVMRAMVRGIHFQTRKRTPAFWRILRHNNREALERWNYASDVPAEPRLRARSGDQSSGQ
jgi:hypothetical protein